uniref:Uncharacterized protein n=1 Tax=Corethron hystrix TaxID=216773 RepID=A0A7S1BD38_9STRA|mmetsp:Transcript_22161/g.50735  ORF Transcript_22161/g.50735 Transcript_22161/m.50735 type:complete len:514 (+) Transcript_22161:288-1829(+)
MLNRRTTKQLPFKKLHDEEAKFQNIFSSYFRDHKIKQKGSRIFSRSLLVFSCILPLGIIYIIVTKFIYNHGSNLGTDVTYGRMRANHADTSVISATLSNFRKRTTYSETADSEVLKLANNVTRAYKLSNTMPEEVSLGTDVKLPGLSACLLVKDDNSRLTEWIAYHFFTLPLRSLIIGVDPSSKQLPSPILNRWNGTDGLQIWQWSDEDYMSDEEVEKRSSKTYLDNHIQRHKIFFRECLLKFEEMGKTWTMAIDSDEFLVFNALDVEGDPKKYFLYGNFYEEEAFARAHHNIMISNWTNYFWNYRVAWFQEWMGKLDRANRNGDSRNPILDELENRTIDDDYIPYDDMEYWEEQAVNRTNILVEMRADMPKVGEMTIEQYIHQHKDDIPFVDRYGFYLPRLLFSSVKNDGCQDHNVKKFQTLNFRQHAKKGHYRGNYLGKTFVDVSRFDMKDFVVSNLHNLMESSAILGDFSPYQDSLFRVHHYLGSYEDYSQRSGDERRNKMVIRSLYSVY